MRYSKYNFNNSVFLKIDDGKVIMLNNDNAGYSSWGMASHVNNLFPVLAFVADIEKKKLVVKKTYIDYEIITKLPIIDKSCEDSSLVRMHNDFISQYAKFTLAGNINN